MPATTSDSSEHLRRLHAQRVAAARRGFASFLELVLADEENRRPLVLAPFHREWTRLVRAHRRAMIWAFVGSGKTSIISVGYVLWRLGREPNLRVGVLRNGEEQAREVIRLLARHIEHNELLHEVFPHLKRAQPWNETAVTVERSGFAKDASVRAFGVMSNVYGSRLDVLIGDDLVDTANSMTPGPREQVADKFFREYATRLNGSANPQLLVVGTPFHKDDLYHRLVALGTPLFKFPITEDDGTPRWPERWPAEKIQQARREVPPAEAARSLDLQIVDPASQVFPEDLLLRAVQRGERYTMLTPTATGWALLHRPIGARLAIGVDPASSQHGDLSAIATVMRHGDGRKELLELQAGHWGAPELVRRILNTHARFAPDAVVIESVAFQASLLGWVRHFDAMTSVVPYQTNSRALSLQNRVGDMELALARNEWVLPSVGGQLRDRETDILCREMRFFARQDHVPDRLAATMLAAWGVDRSALVRAEVGRLDLLSR